MFKITDSTVILLIGGVFKQVAVYRRSYTVRLYAKYGSGYVRLGPDGATSKPKLSWESLDTPEANIVMNRLCGPMGIS